MKRETILLLKSQGLGRDGIYGLAAANLHLYGVAFFGHKGSESDQQKLQRVWKKICKEFPS